MSGDDAHDDEVGYCKPPRHTQFQRGKSGNPSGRPKKNRTFLDDFARVMQEPVVVTVGNKTKKITKQEAVARRQVAQAMKGDQRAIDTVISLKKEVERQPPRSPDISEQRQQELIKHLDPETLMKIRKACAEVAREKESARNKK